MTQFLEKVVLITGGAKRIGKAAVEFLHEKGLSVAIHCNTSLKDAEMLSQTLNQQRKNSSLVFSMDLKNFDQYPTMINAIIKKWGRLDAIINNASDFYSTTFEEGTLEDFNHLFDINLKAPFFLTQAALKPLRNNKGCIINITDIHAKKPLKLYSLYSMSKAGLEMMTKSLAKELAPLIRVNAIAPGSILWPEKNFDPALKEKILQNIPLKQQGTPLEIAKAAWFLMNSNYITGHTISIDGGRLRD